MLDYSQIQALLAVDDEGSFEGAARSLRITAFAITQRIKILEKTLGIALIQRKPTRTSEAGKILCDHAREVIALESEVLAQHHLTGNEKRPIRKVLKIALNDDSLSSWFRQVLNDQSKRDDGFSFDVTLTNCDRSTDLMQTGEVAAAISTRKEPIHGFKSYTLGSRVYRPVASPAFMAKHFSNGVSKTSLTKAPCLRYCKNDTFASDWAEQVFGEVLQLTLFKHPSATSLIKNCLNHQAWTLAPADLVDIHLNSGKLVELVPDQPLNKPLYWHVSGAVVDDVIHVTRAVKDATKRRQ